jgi:DNA polymerase
MKIIALDFETFFDSEYTLKKMTMEAYIRDERFDAHGAAIYNGKTAVWLSPRELKEQCEVWRACQRSGLPLALLAHHAHFDGLILSHHFDFCPDIWLDTLSMARVVFDSGVKNGLDDLATRLGLAPKSVPYELFKGKHWHELDPTVQNMVASGCEHDCVLTWDAFHIMMRGGTQAVPYAFPATELPVVSATVKMFTEPALVGDLDLLGEAWYAERDARNELFKRLRLDGDNPAQQLRSDKIFAQMLLDLGVDPAEKTTAKGNEKYAFAKSDPFMQELLYGDDEEVALLVEARLKAHSSIYMTRVERFGDISTRGAIPIYLAYAAAHTRRWGGGDKQNAQNLPRSDPYNPQKGALRRAIKAPQ